ncbi:MAG TPA: NAD(P)-dependent oxidoreductase [Steroidobacteraceae bacterium]|jgi:nucleoside-diphosphate-sugar epimerase|nr:NAD(P)-dependent oxidoreductase [Steroidobacteraceae bacterium]
MAERVFLAGAAGVIGRKLCPMLLADGCEVVGTTRFADKVPLLRALGVTPVIVDVFDAEALRAAVIGARPGVVVHQLTDLPPGLDPARMAAALPRNARIREIGTRHLLAAAVAAGAHRFVAQSISFVYAPGPLPYREDAPLATGGEMDDTVRGVISLEQQVLHGPLEGIVLRFGKLYGPGTGFNTPASGGPVHVDAAADAARRALTRGAPGIYNVAEGDGTVDSGKAAEAFGWRADFRCG